ncbi:hypothetical protein Tco_0866365 [Tanacetum coccineum]
MMSYALESKRTLFLLVESLVWLQRQQRIKLSYKVNSTGHLARRLRKELSENLLNCYNMICLDLVSVESVNRKKYCLVVTDDCTSKFSWVCDHGTEFKNQLKNEFVPRKESREYSMQDLLHSKMVLQKERIGLSLKPA